MTDRLSSSQRVAQHLQLPQPTVGLQPWHAERQSETLATSLQADRALGRRSARARRTCRWFGFRTRGWPLGALELADGTKLQSSVARHGAAASRPVGGSSFRPAPPTAVSVVDGGRVAALGRNGCIVRHRCWWSRGSSAGAAVISSRSSRRAALSVHALVWRARVFVRGDAPTAVVAAGMGAWSRMIPQ